MFDEVAYGFCSIYALSRLSFILFNHQQVFCIRPLWPIRNVTYNTRTFIRWRYITDIITFRNIVDDVVPRSFCVLFESQLVHNLVSKRRTLWLALQYTAFIGKTKYITSSIKYHICVKIMIKRDLLFSISNYDNDDDNSLRNSYFIMPYPYKIHYYNIK